MSNQYVYKLYISTWICIQTAKKYTCPDGYMYRNCEKVYIFRLMSIEIAQNALVKTLPNEEVLINTLASLNRVTTNGSIPIETNPHCFFASSNEIFWLPGVRNRVFTDRPKSYRLLTHRSDALPALPVGNGCRN